MLSAARNGCFQARRLVVAVPLVLSFAACNESGPTDPCSADFACQVSGQDLVVEAPAVLWPEAQPVDDVTGYRVVQPGDSLDVEVRVLNRGDETSASADFVLFAEGEPSDVLEATVPALAPGAEYVDTLRVAAPEFLYNDRDTSFVRLVIESPDEDPVHANDEAASGTFHVALPVLHAQVIAPDSMRIGETYEISVTIENTGRHASLPAGQIYFCLFDFDAGCGVSGLGVPFGVSARPAIAAGDDWTWTGDVEIPVESSFWEEPLDMSLNVCLAASGETVEDIADHLFGYTCVRDWTQVTALPNPEATCSVVAIAADTVVSSTLAPDCANETGQTWHVFRFDADAGVQYEVRLTGGAIAIIDGNGVGVADFVELDGAASVYAVETTEDGPVYLMGLGDFTLELSAP